MLSGSGFNWVLVTQAARLWPWKCRPCTAAVTAVSHSKLGWWRADQDRSILSRLLSECRTGRLQTNRSPPSRMFGVKSITSYLFTFPFVCDDRLPTDGSTAYNPLPGMELLNRLAPVVVIFPAIIAIGTAGFRLVEGWDWADAVYMSIITVFTVGFTEVHPLTQRGEVFTIVLILLGLGGITYTFSAITNYIVAGELKDILKGRRMRRYIDSVSEHSVVCGYGEMGRQVCKELRRKGKTLVIVDISEEAVDQARKDGFLAVHGDAGLDSVLIQCGIERADGLVVATDEDASNLLVVLSARGFREDIPIVARANLEEVREKLLRSGANGVLFPQGVAGRRMAQMLLHPEISDFVDVITQDESLELILENFVVSEGSGLENRSLKESRIREQTGASIVGLKREKEGVIPSLKSNTVLRAGDIVFALGTREQLDKLGKSLESLG